MTAGYDFHPEARSDLDEIWEFIRADNFDAADRVIAEILPGAFFL
jgi:plasmid stabilization system protein ParE